MVLSNFFFSGSAIPVSLRLENNALCKPYKVSNQDSPDIIQCYPSDLGSCDFGPWRTSENATKYLSCLLQPAAHDKLKLANLQGWILKTHWSIHMEEKKTLPRISHVLIELKSKRLLQRLIKQREKGWGIQYFHWPIPVFIRFILRTYHIILIYCIRISISQLWPNSGDFWLRPL